MAYVISDDCIACGTCIDECPSGAISEGDKYSIDPDACTECGTCASVCPNEAISLAEQSLFDTTDTIGFMLTECEADFFLLYPPLPGYTQEEPMPNIGNL